MLWDIKDMHIPACSQNLQHAVLLQEDQKPYSPSISFPICFKHIIHDLYIFIYFCLVVLPALLQNDLPHPEKSKTSWPSTFAVVFSRRFLSRGYCQRHLPMEGHSCDCEVDHPKQTSQGATVRQGSVIHKKHAPIRRFQRKDPMVVLNGYIYRYTACIPQEKRNRTRDSRNLGNYLSLGWKKISYLGWLLKMLQHSSRGKTYDDPWPLEIFRIWFGIETSKKLHCFTQIAGTLLSGVSRTIMVVPWCYVCHFLPIVGKDFHSLTAPQFDQRCQICWLSLIDESVMCLSQIKHHHSWLVNLPPLTYSPQKPRGLIAGLITGNQWFS